MTTALLSAALAVLLWPDRRAAGYRRAVLVTAARAPVPRSKRFPVPLLGVLGAVGAAAAVSTPLVALLAGTVALAGARSWEAAGRARTREERLAGLAEGLGALAAELRSGRSLQAATTAAVAACGNADSGDALARAVRTPDAASPPRTAPEDDDDPLRAATERISAAVLLSSRTGCSLADVVTAVDGDLRARRGHRQELRAAVAAPRASAMLLAGLPLVGLAMGSGVGADPWHELTGTGTGQVLLTTGVALELAGVAWSRRLVGRVLR